MRLLPPPLILVVAMAIGMPALGGEPTKDERLFALKVRPLLAEKCFACHGKDPSTLKGGLDVTSRAGLLRGGKENGPALVVGDAEESPLYLAVLRTEPGLEMPPKQADALSQEQAWAIRDWINAGAPWPDEATIAAIVRASAAGVTVATSGGLSDDWTNRRYTPENLWAYRPLRRPDVPARTADASAPAATAIDAFVNRTLAGIGLPPAPRADRRTLVRRATFDLTGLPPSPAEIDAFLADPRPDRDAFAALVDRLLASPHYGEQWGRHWLDVVRYADTSGFANDFERPNAWRYRDYVIRSFNRDTPYDRFVTEQLAGDELDPADPERLVAVGFLRMGPWEHTGMSVAKVTRQQFLDDVTDAVGQVFLSHPLQCARCHDHKFDPIPTRDYYRIQAVFATTQFAERPAPFVPEENTRSGFEEKAYLVERIARYKAIERQLERKVEAEARRWYAERGLTYAPRAQLLKRGVPEAKIAPRNLGLSPLDQGMQRICKKYLERHEWELDRYEPLAFSVYSGPSRPMRAVLGRLNLPENPAGGTGTPEPSAILAGGDPFSPTVPVGPGVLSCLLGPDPSAWSPRNGSLAESVVGRRLALAGWLARRQNPVTARSMVNRIWQFHFGRGIVNTPNNFGAMGAKPTHPELLDWLASEFIARGWSIKAMHRLLMNTDAYTRASVHPDPERVRGKDPEGKLYARFLPRRLDAEELRDAMLAASGELNPTPGGVPIRPDMNLEAALQPRQIMGTYAPAYQPSPRPDQRNRRTIYAMKVRGARDPLLEVFNQPSPDTPCERRETSTVTTQAFSLFNGQEPYDRALAMAARLVRQTRSRTEAVRLAFLLTTGREPSEADLHDGLDHCAAMTERHRRLTLPPRVLPREVTRQAVEEMTGERFRFTERLEVYDDYVPDLQAADLDPATRGLAELCLVLLNSNAFVYVD